MVYNIARLNRTVILDDRLVQEYTKVDEIREQSFSIVIRSKFGHNPTKEEVSDAELSNLCNEILFSELKALSLLPNAISFVCNNYEEYKEKTANNIIFDYQVKD